MPIAIDTPKPTGTHMLAIGAAAIFVGPMILLAFAGICYALNQGLHALF